MNEEQNIDAVILGLRQLPQWGLERIVTHHENGYPLFMTGGIISIDGYY